MSLYDADMDDLRDQLAEANRRAKDAEETVTRMRAQTVEDIQAETAATQAKTLQAELDEIEDYVPGPDGHLVLNPKFYGQMDAALKRHGSGLARS